MRIKHTPNESYCLYSILPCEGELFKNIHRWYPNKHYRTKQGALNAIKRIRCNAKSEITKKFKYKIVWAPYPFCSDDDCVTVYNEVPDNE